MKKEPARKPADSTPDPLRKEFLFNYSEAKPNRFASRLDQTQQVVTLDADVSAVFSTQEAVNKALRALIEAMPKQAAPNKAVNRSRRKRGA